MYQVIIILKNINILKINIINKINILYEIFKSMCIFTLIEFKNIFWK